MPEEVVICPVCDNIGEEYHVKPGDKFAWTCRYCNTIIEDNKPFLLETELEKTHYRASPSFCGFGYNKQAHYWMRKRFITHDSRRGIRSID